MTETRHKTVIEIGVDDRQVVGLSKALERAFDAKALNRYEDSLKRIVAQLEKVRKLGGSVGGVPAGAASVGAPGSGAGGTNAHQQAQDARRERAEERRARDLQREQERTRQLIRQQMTQTALGVGGLAAGAVGGSAVASALGAIPYIGGTLGAAAQTSVRLYNEYAQQQQAQAAVFGQTGVGRGGMNHMVAKGVGGYGLAPGMIPGLAAQFAGSSGLTGSRLSGSFGTQLALSQLLGVNGAGGVVGAMETSGGRVDDPSALMEEAVGAGLISGIRETRLDQYLQGVASFAEEARSRGIPLAPSSVLQLFTAFTSSGASFQGEAGSRFASSFGQGMGGAGRGRGFAQGLALRAAGFGSGTSYQQALERLESRDPQAMQAFVQSIRGMASDGDTGAFLIRSAMEGLGVDMSAVQSRELFENGMNVNDASFNQSLAQDTVASRRSSAGGAFDAGRFSGNLALQRQSVGAGQANNAQRIQNLDVRVMRTGMQHITPVMNRLIGSMERLATAFEQGGFGQLATQALAEGVAGVGEAVAAPGTAVVRWAMGDEAAAEYERNTAEGFGILTDPNRSFVGEVNQAVQDNQRRTITAEEARQAVELQAARDGRITGRRGESREQALGRTNANRIAMGLPALEGAEGTAAAVRHLQGVADEATAAARALESVNPVGAGALTVE